LSSFVIIRRHSSSFCRHFAGPESSFVVILSSFRAFEIVIRRHRELGFEDPDARLPANASKREK